MKLYNRYTNRVRRSELRAESTLPEKIIWKHLRNNQTGYKFRRQHGIGKYIVDFYCALLSLVIEIDGDRVHGMEKIYDHDRVRQIYLEKLELIVKRYKASEISNNLSWVLQDIWMTCDELDKRKTN